MRVITTRNLHRAPLVVLMTFAHPVHAQDAATRARDQMNALLTAQEGDRLLERKNCRDAAKAYRVTLQTVAIPPFALKLADALEKCGELVESLAAAQPDGTWLIAQRLTHAEIASRIGCSREMVSRLLKDLERGGYIAIESAGWVLPRPLPRRW